MTTQGTGWTKAVYTPSPDMGSRLHGRILDLEDAHKVTLGFLEKLLDWGHGADAPDLARQEWADARAWLDKVTTDGDSNAA